MLGKTRKRPTAGLLFVLIILLLAACNAAGGAELAASNAAELDELAAAPADNSDVAAPKTNGESDSGSEELNDIEETDGGDSAASGVVGEETETTETTGDSEESEKDETTAVESTAEPTQEIIPTAAPSTPTGTPEVLIEDGVMLRDDRSENLRLATAGWNTNWERHAVEYQEFLSGGPPRDGIRSIDDPAFIPIEDASVWLAGNEPVIALEINGDARAYPLQILIWHEIVNDVVGEVPVIVTFCPLCNSALVFDRRLNGETYEFGTSGLLRNSDLVMYDRTTESLWQQFTGEGIVGDLVGQQLTFLASSLVSFADFRDAFPEGMVQSQATGFDRAYGINPYAGYDTYDSPLSQGGNIALLKQEEDRRLPAAERVVTVSSADVGVDVAYPLSILSELVVINDQLGDQDIAVFFSEGTSSALGAELIAIGEDVGATGVFDPNLDEQKLTFSQIEGVIVDDQTSSIWNVLGQAIEGPLVGKSLEPIVHGDHFWFSWAAFKPDTVIYQE
jgi:hypothetical protein